MRHRNARTKLGRTTAHRKALLRNLAIELIRHERIRTTLVKAKAIRTAVSKVITLAKRQDLHARRQVLAVIPDRAIVAKLFDTLAKRYETRPGGYTRIFKLAPRLGDGAPMAIIELVDREEKPQAPSEPAKKPTFRERLFGSKKPATEQAGAAGG